MAIIPKMLPSAMPAFTPGLSIDFCAGAGVLVAVAEVVDEVVFDVDEVVTEVDKVLLPGGTTVGVAVCCKPETLMMV